MNQTFDLRINSERFRSDFEALARIGDTGDGGVHRPALGIAHLEARAWFREQVEAAGLVTFVDVAGNHSAFLNCGPDGAPTLLVGSHLDSVPYGGRFDGALGVLAALEVLRVVKEEGIQLPVNLEAIDFTDEEGTLIGLLGSSALAGRLTNEDLQNPRGGRESLIEGFIRADIRGETVLGAGRKPGELAGYFELHIEQGERLIRAGADIGIVTAIVGICSYEITFRGRADHAGTISMEDRLDAAQGASGFALGVRNLVGNMFPGCVANVGDIRLLPGAFNIVPEEAQVSLEFRAPESMLLDELEAALIDLAHQEAERFNLGLTYKPLGKHKPSPMHPAAQQAFREACDQLGMDHLPLTSGAGHDAQSLAALCPAGMIFVPSVGGNSHSPNEYTEWQDCVNGANVLLHAALRIALK